MKALIAISILSIGIAAPAHAFYYGDVTEIHCRNTLGHSLDLDRRTNRVQAKFEFGTFTNESASRREPIVPTRRGSDLEFSARVQGVNGNQFGTVSVTENAWESLTSRRVLTIVFKRAERRTYGTPMTCVLETK